MRSEIKRFFSSVIFFINLFFFSILRAGSLGGPSSYFAYQPKNNVFYDQQYARGAVRMENGFTVVSPSSGQQSTHGSSVYMDTCISVSGAIDLRNTNTVILQSDLILDNGATFSTGGKIHGYDRSVILNGDLTIPAGKALHIGGRIAINGNGNKLIIGDSAQLFVDTGATLTLRNLFLQTTKNGPGNPPVQCAASGSQLCLENVFLEPINDFYFNRGQLFIHNDVAVTGTSAFVYRPVKPLMITSGGKLFFDINTTFSVAPVTFTDCPYSVASTTTTNNFIWMADQTSQLYLNGCSFLTTLTGCRLRVGTVIFDNRVTLRSNASADLASTTTTPIKFIHSATTADNPQSVSWSPDGRFLAVVNYNANTLQIFSWSGTGYPIQVTSGIGVTTLNGPTSVSWSPDGRYIAVVNYNANTLQIFSWSGGGNPTAGGSVSLGTNQPQSVSWSPDGRFIAISNYGNNTLQVFSFNGIGNPIQVTSGNGVATGLNPFQFNWSPDGRFIAVVNYSSSAVQIFSFNGGLNSTAIGTITYGISYPVDVSWSPDGRFLAVTNDNVGTNQNKLLIFRFYGPGTPVSVGSASTGVSPYCASWSPDGRYIAVASWGSSTLQIFSFTGSGNPIQLTTGTGVAEAGSICCPWSPDGRFIAVTGKNTSNTLQIFGANYIVNRTSQAPSNSLIFGNSALGSSYDMSVRGLAGSQISVDGLINYDCVS